MPHPVGYRGSAKPVPSHGAPACHLRPTSRSRRRSSPCRSAAARATATRSMEAKGGWATTVSPDLAAFIAEVRSFYLATASRDGQPYIQHRGGPQGFLHVLDEQDAGVRRFQRQPAIHHHRQPRREFARLHLPDGLCQPAAGEDCGARARVVEDDPELMRRLTPRATAAGPSRSSCSRSRPGTPIARSTSRRWSSPRTSRRRSTHLKDRIAQLEQENAALRAAQGSREERGET